MTIKMTLLQLTQSVLNSLDSDTVNSITDTIEAQQVAQIIQDTYNEIITTYGIPEHQYLGQLEGLADVTHPNYLKIPDDVYNVSNLRYDLKRSTDTVNKWTDIAYQTPANFLQIVQSRNATNTNVTSITDFNSVVLYVINDQPPSYWTTFDDQYVVFDSFDSGVESTMEEAKNSVIASKYPTWTMADDFVPDLDSNLFPLLLTDSKNMAFAVLKQSVNGLVNQRARQQKVFQQNEKHRFTNLNAQRYPDYGRRSSGAAYENRRKRIFGRDS